MIPTEHPYWHFRAVVEARPEAQSIPFSYYNYKPQTVEDRRVTWLVPMSDFQNPDFVENLMRNTPPGHELAVHSDVHLTGGHTAHLVMVDMSTAVKSRLENLRALLGDSAYRRMSWFNSGRSFHGYGQDLLSEAEWVKFMGLLLLANRPGSEPTVDPRWIGHRLLAGYSALRWTHNTAHYLVTPTKLDM